MMHARHAQTGAVMKIEENTNDYLPLRDVVFNTLRESILKGEMTVSYTHLTLPTIA